MAPWTETQKKRLVSQIRIWGNQWDKIADHPELQGRNGKACKSRAGDAWAVDAVAAIPPVDDLRAAGVTLGDVVRAFGRKFGQNKATFLTLHHTRSANHDALKEWTIQMIETDGKSVAPRTKVDRRTRNGSYSSAN